jgi:hypothetical protein
MTSPRLGSEVVSPATVAVLHADLVMDTFGLTGEPIRLTGSMGWGTIKAEATGMSGLDTMVMKLKGKITSQVSAEGTFVALRNGKEAYRGTWALAPRLAQGRRP